MIRQTNIYPPSRALGRVYVLLVRLAQEKRTATVTAATAQEQPEPAKIQEPISIVHPSPMEKVGDILAKPEQGLK